MQLSKFSPLAFLLTGMLAFTGCDDGDGGSDTDTHESDTHSHESDTESHETETGSETDGTDTAAPSVDYDADIQPIWTASCSCHISGGDGTMSAPYLTLNDGMSLDELVAVDSTQLAGMARVTAGDPSNSYLWLKLNNIHLDAGGSGNVMPPAGMLAQDDLDKIEAWINSL